MKVTDCISDQFRRFPETLNKFETVVYRFIVAVLQELLAKTRHRKFKYKNCRDLMKINTIHYFLLLVLRTKLRTNS